MNEPLLARLAEVAAVGQSVTYGQLARDLGWRMAELTAALEQLMEADTGAGLPLRASVCAGRLNAGLPAQGFFLKAAELGHDVSDPAGFVARHRAALALTSP